MAAPTESVFDGMKNFTFGAMSLGKEIPASMDADLTVAREALDAPIWFHASPTYNRGMTFMILRLAFETARRTPRMIIKIRDARPDLLRFEVEDACRRLGLDAIDVIQLVSMDHTIVDDLAGDGPVSRELRVLRSESKVKGAVLFLRDEHAGAAARVWPTGSIDGFTFYWNPLQCSCAEEDWSFIVANDIPVLALRTLAGGGLDAIDDSKRDACAQLLKDHDIADWTELCLRYAASCPVIRTSIGGTSRLSNLRRYLDFAIDPKSLDPSVVEKIESLRAG